MIRLIQRRLIIPRGDTGTFTVPVLATKNTGDVAVFSIIDTMTDKKVFEKIVNVSGDTMTIEFSHYDTVNLPVGKYVWDIKFYQNPEFMDGVLVNGVEVDSYYAAFTMPICEIRQTGDNLLMADDAPGTELTPDQLDILNAAVNETNAAKNQANESAASANTAATTAADKADEATAKAEEATAKAEEATAALNELKEILPTLAEVATSGSYEDLEDKPFIPSRVSDLTDDSGHYTKPANGIPASDLEETYLTAHQDLSNYVQKTDYATTDNAGVVKINAAGGIGINKNSHALGIVPSSETDIKNGTEFNRPIVPYYQHTSAFYGLAKAAGDTTQSQSNNAVGTYTDSAKIAIQQMLGVPSTAAIPTAVSQLQNDSGYLTSFTETDPTVPAWAKAAQKPSYTAAEVGAPAIAEMNTAIGEAVGQINSFDIAVVQVLPTQDISTHTIYLVPKTGDTNDVYDEYVYINNAWEMVGNTQVDLSNYVQKTDYATSSEAGVVKVGNGLMINATNAGQLDIRPTPSFIIKMGVTDSAVVTISGQHESTFYGLAKAAGDTTQSQSSNTVGTYTPEAKGAIQQMLGVSDLIATPENNLTASKVYAIGDVFTANGKLYKATAAIAADAAIIPDGAGANCEETSVGEGFVKFTDIATASTAGVVKVNPAYGVSLSTARNDLVLNTANSTHLKAGQATYNPVVPAKQHESTFYGLAKAAGADEKDSTLPVGTYTDTAKSAIRTMIGAASNNVIAVQDTQPTDTDTKIWLPETAEIPVEVPTVAEMNAALSEKVGDVWVNGVSIIENGVANFPIGSTSNYGLFRIASEAEIKDGLSLQRVIAPGRQTNAVFYGLAKAAGDITQSASGNAVGTYTDNAKASIKSMLGIVDGSTGTVDITGATPTINAVENTRYVCGEVTSLSFTPPSSGISIVRFTSGSTVTVLTIPSTVKFPEWFDPTALETNTIYEICITDGTFGAVMSWAL